MGYQPGKGLGKELQGRSQPVEAQVRKGRGAVGNETLLFELHLTWSLLLQFLHVIGMYGAEHKNEPAKKQASDDEEEKEYKKNLAHWRKGKEKLILKIVSNL